MEGSPRSSRFDLQLAIVGIFSVFVVGGLSLHMVIVGLPATLFELGGNQVQYTWTVAITLLGNAASTPIWGKLADIYSKKLLFQLSGFLLMVAAVLGFWAPTIELLLVSRLIQGVALGGIGTLALTILGVLVSPRERGRYAGYIGASTMLAAAGGPLLGGIITDSLGWRWTFAVLLPLIVVGLVLVQRTLSIRTQPADTGIDYTGAVILVISSSIIILWLSVSGVEGFFKWFSWQSLIALLVSILFLVIFAVVERRVKSPIISIEMITRHTPLLTCISAASIAVCMFGLPPFLMQYFQMGYGLSPTLAGAMIVPFVLGNVFSTILTGWLIARSGRWKGFLLGGAILLTSSLLGLSAAVRWSESLWLIGALLLTAGLGFGAQLQNLMLVIQNSVEIGQLGQASSLLQFFRTFGGAVGSAVLGAVTAMYVGGLVSVGPAASFSASLYSLASSMTILVAAGLSAPAIVASALLKETQLRSAD